MVILDRIYMAFTVWDLVLNITSFFHQPGFLKFGIGFLSSMLVYVIIFE